jgi:enoyl-CoA hydratase/carnithine racemase
MAEGVPVTVQREDRVAVVTLDNPPVNTLSMAALEALSAAVGTAEADPVVKAIVITGAGGKAFSAGADLREMDAARAADGGRAYIDRGQALCAQIAACSKPVVAAVNGVAFGGGLELALACHLRVCSEQARLGQTEINLGIMPGWGGSQRLPRLVGPARALALILTGDTIDAQAAHRIGVVDFLAPTEETMATALALAGRIAAKSGPAVAFALRAVVDGNKMPLENGLRHEADLFVALMGSDDAREGFAAFFEKRPPHFTDR